MASKRPPSVMEVDSEDETMSQRSKRTNRSCITVIELSPDDRNRLIGDIVFYLMAQNRKKTLIKRPEIFRAVGLSNHAKVLQEDIFGAALKKLLHVFGICANPVPSEKAGAISYILVNKLEPITKIDPEYKTISEHIQLTEEEHATRGLLFSILALIYMSGGVIRDDQLVAFLKKMGLHGEETNATCDATRNAFGGNVKNLVDKEFAGRLHYLEVKKEEGSDPDNPVLEYRWGVRATEEVKKSTMLKHLARIYNCPMTAFEQQMNQIKKDEGNEHVFDNMSENEDDDDDEEAGAMAMDR